MARHPIDTVSLTFVGPDDKVGEARKMMRVLGFAEAGKKRVPDDAIPWRESGQYNQAELLPGILLAGARYREGLTQQELSSRTGIQRRHISEMEGGKRPIGKSNARKLAGVLKIDPRRLLMV
jgi:predicted transcriptional regulator